MSYDPSAAVEYARKYWNNYNPDYHNYANDGGDCANFVSQCLIAGGLNFKDCTVNRIDDKGCLQDVVDLKSSLSQKGWHNSTQIPPSFKAGYPVFLQKGSHVMLASSFDGKTVKVSGHTNNRWDYEVGEKLIYYYL